MADDFNQRNNRSNEPPRRGAPTIAPGANAASDPLAELARLIGQNDPFAEFGRDGARRGVPPRPAEPAADWSPQPAGAGYVPQTVAPAAPPNFGAGDYYGATAAADAPAPPAPDFPPPPAARQPYGKPPFAPDLASYRGEQDDPRYTTAPAPGFEGEPYKSNNMHQAEDEEDIYDDVPPPRRRMGIMAIAAVFALAVIGTAGAFGYRALFGSSGSNGPTPVITADATPSKIVPAIKSKDPQSNKLIYDRVNERGQGEKIVSREEQPIELSNKQTAAQPGQVQPPALGSGVVGMEPKKIHTITIHPDQPATAGNAPPVMTSSGQAPARVTNPAPAGQPAVVRATRSGSAAAEAEPLPRQTKVANAAPPQRQAPAPASSNAPLSLSPDASASASAPARPAPNTTRTAAVPPPAQIAPTAARTRNAAAGGSGAYVQVSSQRSEAEAQASFHSLQAKYPSQLGGRQPLIRRVDLGAKGIYFRAMVGPFASSNEAGQLCANLKAAGGNCIVQRN